MGLWRFSVSLVYMKLTVHIYIVCIWTGIKFCFLLLAWTCCHKWWIIWSCKASGIFEDHSLLPHNIQAFKPLCLDCWEKKIRVVEHSKKPRESQICEFISVSVQAAVDFVFSSKKVHVEFFLFWILIYTQMWSLLMNKITIFLLPRTLFLILFIFQPCEQTFFVCSGFM